MLQSLIKNVFSRFQYIFCKIEKNDNRKKGKNMAVLYANSLHDRGWDAFFSSH